LKWAFERESSLGKAFVLPVLAEPIGALNLPDWIADRLQLRLQNHDESSVEKLAKEIADSLFHICVKRISNPPPGPLINSRPSSWTPQPLGQRSKHDHKLAGLALRLIDLIDARRVDVVKRVLTESLSHDVATHIKSALKGASARKKEQIQLVLE